MTRPAQVRSIEALDAFRSTLVVYRDQAGRILDDVHHDAIRTRTWLETDAQLHWRHLIRQRAKLLAQAEQELLTARLSGHPEAVQDRRMAVQRAKTALAEAETGLAHVQHWLRRYDTEVLSRLKSVAQLRILLANDLEQALGFLAGATTTLAQYAALEARPAESPAASTPPEPIPNPGDPA